MPSVPRLPALVGVAVLFAVGISLGLAPPAAAHPFLVRTDPANGARLANRPRSVSLQFSEPLGQGPAQVSVGRQGRVPELLRVVSAAGGRVLRGDVALGPGVYTVRWRVVADDGHLSEGQFAFAVGAVPGSLPRAQATAAPANPLRSAAAWVFVVGLALSLGSVATAFLVDHDRHARTGTLSGGLVVALAATTTMWAASVAGFAGPAGTTRQQVLLAATTALLAVALLFRRRPAAAGFLAVAAAVAWAARGQLAVAKGGAGIALDAVHLLAAAVWLGALALLVGDLWRARRDPRGLTDRARRYATLAVMPVVVLAAAGGVSALLMVPAPGDLWSTGYGRLLGVKTLLFAVALVVAWWARRRTLRPGGVLTLGRLTVGEAVLLAAVLVVASVLGNTAPPPPRVAAATLLGPPPLAGPVVRDAGLAGILTVAVAAGDGQLQVEVLAPGGAARGTRADVTIMSEPGKRLRLKGCGDGCLSGPWDPPAAITAIRVRASAPGWRGGAYSTRLGWPPAPEDPGRLARVLAVMRAQSAVELTERTSSGPDSVVVPTTFRIAGADLVDQAPYASGQAADVRPLPGEPGLSLYLPGDRIWVTLWLDGTGRISRERIVDVGHLIERQYRYPPP